MFLENEVLQNHFCEFVNIPFLTACHDISQIKLLKLPLYLLNVLVKILTQLVKVITLEQTL